MRMGEEERVAVSSRRREWRREMMAASADEASERKGSETLVVAAGTVRGRQFSKLARKMTQITHTATRTLPRRHQVDRPRAS